MVMCWELAQLIENTDRQTDPMLCYSNGTDNNFTEDGKYRMTPKTEQLRPHFIGKPRDVSIAATAVNCNSVGGTHTVQSLVPVPASNVKRRASLCYKCQSDQHIWYNCPLRKPQGGGLDRLLA